MKTVPCCVCVLPFLLLVASGCRHSSSPPERAGAAPAASPDVANAASYYEQAFERMPPFPKDVARAVPELVREPWQRPPEGMVAYISEDRGILALTGQGAAQATCDFMRGEPVPLEQKRPHIGKARSLGRYLVLKGRYFEHQRTYEQAIACYGLAMSLGTHVAQGNATLAFMVGTSIRHMADTAFGGAALYPAPYARQALALHRELTAARPSLAKAMADENAALRSIDAAMFASKILTEKEMRKSFKESLADEDNISKADGDALVDAVIEAAKAHGFFDPAVHVRHLHELADSVFGAYVRAAEPLTLSSWQTQHEQIVEEYGLDMRQLAREQAEMVRDMQLAVLLKVQKAQEEGTGTNPETRAQAIAAAGEVASGAMTGACRRVAQIMVSMIVPVMRNMGAKECRNRLDEQAARLRLALAVHKAEHGSYPNALTALVPTLLRAVPTDPYDGEPLRYRKDGDDYVLYSVGKDLTDDGGTTGVVTAAKHGITEPVPKRSSPPSDQDQTSFFGLDLDGPAVKKAPGRDIVFRPPVAP